MLKREDYFMIQEMKAKGMHVKDIAHALGVHPRTIRRALERGHAPRGRKRNRVSQLVPFQAEIDRMLGEGIWNAMVIFREVQGKGYPGSVITLRRYIQPKRVLRSSRKTVRFETEPGEQLQNDWGEIGTEVGGERTKVCFSINTLGYSRRFHVWCTTSLDAEHTYEGLVRAFESLGGVTREVLVDNQKSAVIAHRKGEKAVFHPRFLDLADHYGFVPRACRPYRARTKGKDERMVRYVKENFFVRYASFESLSQLNNLTESWLRDEADKRVHGTVKEVVADRFAREVPRLGPLPAVRFDTSYREYRQVSWDGYVEVRGNRYSVPASLCGQTVAVRIGLDDTVRVYDREDRLAATHRLRSFKDGAG